MGAFKYGTRVRESSVDTGPGPWALAGAVDTTYQTISDVLSDTDYSDFTIRMGDDWVSFEGEYDTDTGELSVRSIHETSNGDTDPINFGAGTKDIIMELSAKRARDLTVGAWKPGLINGKLVEGTPSAGAVTYALKTLAGNDASASDPIIARFPDGSSVTLTAALSVTLPSGATFGFSNTVGAYIWWALVNDGGTLRIAGRNCSDASGVAGFPANGILSSTVLNTSSDSARVTYTDSAVSAKPFIVIGRSEYDSGLTTAGTWTAADRVVQWVPGMPLPGDVLQTLYASTNTSTTSTSTSYGSDSNLAQSITLAHKGNLLEYAASGGLMGNSVGVKAWATMHIGGIPVGLTAESYNPDFAFHRTTASFIGMTKPNSTSSLSVSPRVKTETGGNTATFGYSDNNDGSTYAQMVVKEIMG